jgi:hypothetical protein
MIMSIDMRRFLAAGTSLRGSGDRMGRLYTDRGCGVGG